MSLFTDEPKVYGALGIKPEFGAIPKKTRQA